MIGIDMARRLKQAGLEWRPAERDCFALPDRLLDEQVFVFTQIPAFVQLLSGQPTITFHGSVEWALDYVLLAEAIWLPSETQLRERLAAAIGDDAPLRLDRLGGGYRCQIALAERLADFEAPHAEDAYAQALLAVLERRV